VVDGESAGDFFRCPAVMGQMGFHVRADDLIGQPSSGMAATGTFPGPLMGSVPPVSDKSYQRGRSAWFPCWPKRGFCPVFRQ
jgi:hypothetical protein